MTTRTSNSCYGDAGGTGWCALTHYWPPPADLLIREGTVPGDHAGPRLFSRTYGGCISRAVLDHSRTSAHATLLVAACPQLLGDGQHDIGMILLLEDLAAKAIGRTVGGLCLDAGAEGASVRARAEEIGIGLNGTKSRERHRGPVAHRRAESPTGRRRTCTTH